MNQAKNAEIRSIIENRNINELMTKFAEIKLKLVSDDFINANRDIIDREIIINYGWVLELLEEIDKISWETNQDLLVKIKILENNIAEEKKISAQAESWDKVGKVADLEEDLAEAKKFNLLGESSFFGGGTEPGRKIRTSQTKSCWIGTAIERKRGAKN